MVQAKSFTLAQKEFIVRKMQEIIENLSEIARSEQVPKYVYWKKLHTQCASIHEDKNTWESFRVRIDQHVLPFFKVPTVFLIKKRNKKKECFKKHTSAFKVSFVNREITDFEIYAEDITVNDSKYFITVGFTEKNKSIVYSFNKKEILVFLKTSMI